MDGSADLVEQIGQTKARIRHLMTEETTEQNLSQQEKELKV